VALSAATLVTTSGPLGPKTATVTLTPGAAVPHMVFGTSRCRTIWLPRARETESTTGGLGGPTAGLHAAAPARHVQVSQLPHDPAVHGLLHGVVSTHPVWPSHLLLVKENCAGIPRHRNHPNKGKHPKKMVLGSLAMIKLQVGKPDFRVAGTVQLVASEVALYVSRFKTPFAAASLLSALISR